MTDTQALYHAPVFEPTVDELAFLKKLELGQVISWADALRTHVSKRLYEWGLVGQSAEGNVSITAQGMLMIRREE